GFVRECGTVRTSTTSPISCDRSNSTNSGSARVECPIVKNGCVNRPSSGQLPTRSRTIATYRRWTPTVKPSSPKLALSGFPQGQGHERGHDGTSNDIADRRDWRPGRGNQPSGYERRKAAEDCSCDGVCGGQTTHACGRFEDFGQRCGGGT